MNIIFLKDYNNDLNNIFYEYDDCSKKIFESDGVEQKKYILLYKHLKNKIDKWVVNKLRENEEPNLIFKENEYEKKIKNLVVKNLLSNGLYKKSDISEILEKYRQEIDSDIIKRINKFYDNYDGIILIWNINIEVESCNI
ncbi:hypothetical protein TPELB_20050 [Terrisporobacter petrolearius]|uniref:Uncharacterized protein n=1 Tax=Terrisporobacter petrolearius TaxID=1460447 RepID=A0ABZ3FG56_9FIRM